MASRTALTLPGITCRAPRGTQDPTHCFTAGSTSELAYDAWSKRRHFCRAQKDGGFHSYCRIGISQSMLKQKNLSTTARRLPSAFPGLVIFNVRRDLVWLSLLVLEAARRQLLTAAQNGRASAAHIRSTAVNPLHLCRVVSFDLHNVSQFRAIGRNFDPIDLSNIPISELDR